MKIRPLALLTLLALPLAAAAQSSPKIIVGNVAGAELPLASGSTVEFLANGNLRVQCVATNGRCTATGIGGSDGSTGTNAPAAFTLSGPATAPTANTNFNLSWTSADSQVCFGESPAGVANWTGAALGTSGPRALSLAAGTYEFGIRCYNAGGSRLATATVTVQAGTPPPTATAYCAEYYGDNIPTHPSFTAYGLEKFELSFLQVFGREAGGGSTATKGVPGKFMGPIIGRYMAIPFTMSSDVMGTLGSQSRLTSQIPQGENSSTQISGGSVVLSISPCAGDFRRPVPGSDDIYLRDNCRSEMSFEHNLVATAVSGLSGCPAPKGKVMYLNIATYDLFGTGATQPLTLPPTTTCGNVTSNCGIAMKQQ